MVLAEPLGKKVYTPEEVSQILGLHLNTVYRHLRNKKIRGKQIGRLWLIPASTVANLLDDGGLGGEGGSILDSSPF
jgi:excisionase family DNA binding protein